MISYVTVIERLNCRNTVANVVVFLIDKEVTHINIIMENCRNVGKYVTLVNEMA